MDLQDSKYGSSNLCVFSVTFMKFRLGSVDMRQKHRKVITGRDVSFCAIKNTLDFVFEYIKSNHIKDVNMLLWIPSVDLKAEA